MFHINVQELNFEIFVYLSKTIWISVKPAYTAETANRSQKPNNTFSLLIQALQQYMTDMESTKSQSPKSEIQKHLIFDYLIYFDI